MAWDRQLHVSGSGIRDRKAVSGIFSGTIPANAS
jgi:hypothetical protein